MNPAEQQYTHTAVAHANIAIAKYWGKRDEQLNLPLFDSVAFGVNDLCTQTTATWSDEATEDALYIDGWHVPLQRIERMQRMMDIIRTQKGWSKKCVLQSHNAFAHSSGLASSASGAAAAAYAMSCAAGLDLSPAELSVLARHGSGSAARSIHAGWTRWRAGSQADGSDSYAVQFASPDHWPLNVFVVQLSSARKPVSSTECMKQCELSPFWQTYCAEAFAAADIAQKAVTDRNFGALAAAAHHNAMMLHALIMSCPQPVCYFEPQTIAVVQKIFKMSTAIPVCCTIDAGPNVVVLCEDIACPFVKNEIMAIGVPFIQTTIGGGTKTAA